MPVDVACPSCLRSLRVQEEHLGGQVRCPVCGAIFVAVAPRPATAVTADDVQGPGERRRRKRRRRRGDPIQAKLAPPAICLMMLGGAVALMHLVLLVMYMAGMDAIPRGPAINQLDRSWLRGIESCNICFPLMGSAVIIVAGVKMLQREHYKIALTGSILAMIPCTAGLGCVFGIPLGIWGLIVLRKPEVMAAFKEEGVEENAAEWPEEE